MNNQEIHLFFCKSIVFISAVGTCIVFPETLLLILFFYSIIFVVRNYLEN